MSIFITSDTHFGHQRGFLYEPRGFSSIEEHDEEIIKRWNETVGSEDDVYLLGDLMLNDNEHGMECLRRLNGKLHIVRGNHDTDARWELYKTLPNVVEMADVIRLKVGRQRYYLSHYPTLTGNLESEHLSQMEINVFGHTHQQIEFYQDMPFMYHCGLDTHGRPILLENIRQRCKEKVQECVNML